MDKIITIGGITKDISFLVSDGVIIKNHRDLLHQEMLAFERGSKIRVDKFHHLFGGGAANAAVNLAKSGFEVSCAGAVGDDYEGREALANLKKHQIKTELIAVEKGKETGFSFVLIEKEDSARKNLAAYSKKAGTRIIFANRCANDDFFLTETAGAKLRAASWLYLASLGHNWEKTLKVIVKQKKAKLAWNPGSLQYGEGAAKMAPYLKHTELLLMNSEEAIELVSSYPAYRHQNRRFFLRVENLLAALKSFGPKIVVITSGEDGADAFDGTDFYHQDIIKEKNKIDTTGIGDVFNSSVLAGLILSGGQLGEALKAAAKNAAAKVGSLGAQNGIVDLRPYFKTKK